MQVVPHPIEQPFTVAEQRRRKMDLHLVDRSCREVLPGSFRAARESDVFAAGRAPRQLQPLSNPPVTKVKVVPPSSSSGSRA